MPGHKLHPSQADPNTWKQLKAQAWLACNGKPICPRCNLPITGPLNKMDLGHSNDWATQLPGQSNTLQLEHAQCNRRAGQLLGDEMKRQRKAMPSPFITTELADR